MRAIFQIRTLEHKSAKDKLDCKRADASEPRKMQLSVSRKRRYAWYLCRSKLQYTKVQIHIQAAQILDFG